MTENTYERVDRMRKYLTEELPPEEHVSFIKELKEKGYFHQKLPISSLKMLITYFYVLFKQSEEHIEVALLLKHLTTIQ